MSLQRTVNAECVCGGQAMVDYSSENKLCCRVKCTVCGREGSVEVMSAEAETSWTNEMKKLKGKS